MYVSDVTMPYISPPPLPWPNLTMANAFNAMLPSYPTQQQIAVRDKSDDKSNVSLSFPSPLSLRHVKLQNKITVKLQNENLWQKFHTETNEMIITKLGRRMYPSIQLIVSGLEKHERYYIVLEIQPACSRRYKYCRNSAGQDGRSDIGGWSYAGPAEPQPRFDRRIYMHPDGPAMGDYWMKNTISFTKLKLTNNVVERNHVLLTSMHKYIPTIRIIRCNNAETLTELFSHPAASFTFNETTFIAVTAYQNKNITQLKIDNNPFAKGFTDVGRSRCKRKYQDLERKDDQNSSFESAESNSHCESSLDGLQESSESRISDDDACNTVKRYRSTSITTNHESPLREEDNNNETPIRFHRPWLNSPSSDQPTATETLPLLQISPYNCWYPTCVPRLPQIFLQQPNLNYYPSMLHMNLSRK
ncbi:T-box transcription factor TBX3-like [Linepithema humile]|uniref:T-box transcription factor TBX3-like n=1 Tax=Linepithema humile TaxID=83485 RepID=UPI0006236101|nr:PREDICTED: T-box transcription factor TBX3-like [Linepithema humile]